MERSESRVKLHADISSFINARQGVESDKITERKVLFCGVLQLGHCCGMHTVQTA